MAFTATHDGNGTVRYTAVQPLMTATVLSR